MADSLHRLLVTRFGYKCEMPETIIVSLPSPKSMESPANLIGKWFLNQTTDVRVFSVELGNDEGHYILAKMTGCLSERQILFQVAKLVRHMGLKIDRVQDTDFDFVKI